MSKDIQAHLRNEKVSELMPERGVWVDPATSVAEAVVLMQQHRAGCVLVCEGRELRGIFTEQDYLHRVLARQCDPQRPIRECMSRDPVTIPASASVATLIGRIHKGRYRRLPVVDEAGTLVGVVTVRKLVHHLAEHCSATVFNIAPVSKPVQHDREGA